MTTIVSVLSMVNPKIYGMIVDNVIYNGETDKLLPLAACIVLTTLLISVSRFGYQICFEKASQGVLYDMRNKVYRKLMMEDFRFYQKKRTGDLMSRLTGDMESIRYFIAFPKTQSASDLMTQAPNDVDEKQLRELHIKTSLLMKKDK